MASTTSWLERHDALKAQAEELANSARREAESAASSSGQHRGGMQSLAARRKLVEMSRVIASMEKLSQDNLCAALGFPALPSPPLLPLLLCMVLPQTWRKLHTHTADSRAATRPPPAARPASPPVAARQSLNLPCTVGKRTVLRVRAARRVTSSCACAFSPTSASYSACSVPPCTPRALRTSLRCRRAPAPRGQRRPPPRGSTPTPCDLRHACVAQP